PESALRGDRTGGPRVARSPYVFRGMMVGMAGVAVVLDRVTGRRDLTWRFAKAQARTLARLLGVRVTMRGLEHLDPHASYVFTPTYLTPPCRDEQCSLPTHPSQSFPYLKNNNINNFKYLHFRTLRF